MSSYKNKNSGLTAEIRVRRCYGCGSILQSTDPDEAGYVPAEKLESDEEVLCARCFKLRNYSTLTDVNSIGVDYVKILEEAKKKESLVVYVLNAFCLTSSFLKGIGKNISENVLVVINKHDILPSTYSEDYLKAYVQRELKKEDIYPLDILFCSAVSSNSYNVDKVMDAIMKYRENKDVYFIGAKQVGKSSLINCLLKGFINPTRKTITTSPYPGTTLNVISIPLDNKSYIYDTPGIDNKESLISFVEPSLVRYIIPRTRINPEHYSAKDGQSFIFSNFARIDFVEGEKTDFTFYKSNDLIIERAKLNRADDSFNSKCEIDTKTKTSKIHSIKDLELTELDIEYTTPCRIRIVGLGFVDFIGNKQKINVYAPKGIKVILEKNEVDNQ